MIQTIKAFIYALFHRNTIELVAVRRYVDARSNFIGELYMDGKMIGMTCDSLPYQAGLAGHATACTFDFRYDFRYDFTDLMPRDTLRVGGNTPAETAHVRRLMERRRYCDMRFIVLNRFIEHVLEADRVR